MSAKLQGIFTPTLVPLDERGQINEPELRRFISWLIDHGVHGLYPNGSTGEFTRFSEAERKGGGAGAGGGARRRGGGAAVPLWGAFLLQPPPRMGVRLFRRDPPPLS